MPDSDLITDYTKDARALKALAENILESPPPGLPTTTRELVEELLKQAKKTEDLAKEPVNIGIVGQFNAGKSLLLGALMGFADGLPVSPVTTTGNVTALHFSQQEGLATTEFRSYTIEYLSREEAIECLQVMLDETRKAAKDSKLRDDLVVRLGQFKASDQNSLRGLDSWCASAWEAGQDPALRASLHELVAFARAYFQCGPGICGAPEYVVTPEVARAGLTLPAERALATLRYSDLADAPRPISSAPDKDDLSAEIIRTTFPLIRRVRIDVALSREIWNLAGLTGVNKFVLLDFPGLGSAFSGIRDRYLCDRELQRVQTILIVLVSDRSDERGGWDTFTPMRKNRPDIQDSVLVALGRFDKLELGEAGERQLRDLGKSADGPSPKARARLAAIEDSEEDSEEAAPPPPTASKALTEESVREQVGVLRNLLNVAESMVPGRKDRIVPVSPMLYFHHLRETQPALQIGSSQFLENLDSDVQQALRVRPLWESIAKKLREGRPRQPDEHGLADWLDDFVVDGGINRLRKLIGSHVYRHGLNQLARDVAVEARALRQRHEALCVALPRPGGPSDVELPPDRIEAVQKALERLGEYYRQLILAVEVKETLVVKRDNQLVSVAKVVEKEAEFLVSEWPQWATLFQASRDGYINERTGDIRDTLERVVDHDDDDDGDDDHDHDHELGSGKFPATSDDFYLAFEKTLDRLKRFTEAEIQKGLDFWLEQIAQKVSGERVELGPLLDAPGLRRRIKKLRLGDDGNGLIIWLKAAVNPTQLKDHIQRLGPPIESDPDRELVPGRLFPLVQNVSGREQVRIFGWARALQEDPDPDFRPARNLSHVCQVVRFREDFIRILSEEMVQTVSLAVARLNDRLFEILNIVNARLAKASGDIQVRDTLLKAVYAQSATKASPDDSREDLQQIASFRWTSPN